MMPESTPKRIRGDAENRRESVCRNITRCRKNIDAVDAEVDQQDGNQKVERAAQGVVGFKRRSRESVSLLTPLVRHFRDNNHLSPIGGMRVA